MVLMAKWQVTVISPLDTAVIVIITISTSITSQYSLCWGFRIKGKAKKKRTFQFIFCMWLYRVVVMGGGGGGQVLACHCRGVIASSLWLPE